ncbi:hypothetical protein lbkm_1055 [Lachnospiraceae bacterium KM106-2]|nr:hypothetical protein lbkm_1055 [Lachnospiraceae bacterium KM106-2]
MGSSITGNLFAIVFILFFQACGIVTMRSILQRQGKPLQVLIGSVTGSVMLHWLPTIFAFFIGFNRISNLLGAAAALSITAITVYLLPVQEKHKLELEETRTVSSFVSKYGIWFLIIPTFLLIGLILNTHTIQYRDGSIYTGQCTFGDMNLHLGIITSIAKQGTFPPQYSIFPGVKLSYPFLADSISSSLYVFGCSLRLAYILPMLIAFLQVFYGFYLFILQWFHKKSVAYFAWILFFFNGGFGFAYFLDKIVDNPDNVMRIFSEFYKTPTNLVDYNVRWVNTIVDMLIPQRATLFGYAILFPVLALLYQAMTEREQSKKKQLFLVTGLLISALPMIHTHSFLTMGVVCAGWLLRDVLREGTLKEMASKILSFLPVIIVVYLILMEVICFNSAGLGSDQYFMILALILLTLVILLILGITFMDQKKRKDLFMTWGILLGVVLLLAFPQLFYWTFRQASQGSFLKGYFNWANEGDSYIIFYIKNLGVFSLLLIPALLKSKKHDFSIAFPAIVLWIIAEFVVFQPNVYDNNKLLLPAYAILCGVVASYGISLWESIKGRSIQGYVAVIVLTLCMLSALLTMRREYVSEYELYDKEQLAVANYIEENTAADAIILTDERHNNAISSLTGRNIVCGTPSFLYYHGIHYKDREAQVTAIYQDAKANQDLIKELKIQYILISPYERNSYTDLNEDAIESVATCIYNKGDIKLYQVH